ncbi:MAG TPA: AGE family epimerase/isomerase [Mycobacteriales bacterium]|nr:AGE family epimerase/isomerase [Mycobacteriales bacterium]
MDARFTLARPEHRAWAVAEAHRLLDFARSAADREHGGFTGLDTAGRPVPGVKPLYATARMTYAFSLGCLLGRPDAELVEHGLAALRGPFADRAHGGWHAALADDGSTVADGTKTTYAHAFVLLAAATAATAGFAAADLLDAATEVVDQHLWAPAERMCVESYPADWSVPEDYRGVNANMHAVEAFLAAHAATGDRRWLDRAAKITARVVSFAAANGWRIPEHFTADWRPLPDYNAGRPADPFRPYGATPGHALEWARLVLQVWAQTGDPALLPAARALFDRAVADAWDLDRYGFAYTTDWSGRPVVTARLHWPLTEGIGAARALAAATGEDAYADRYAEFWALADRAYLDREHGGWWHELDEDGRPAATIWAGKDDAYHALQACLLQLLPANQGLAPYLAGTASAAVTDGVR